MILHKSNVDDTDPVIETPKYNYEVSSDGKTVKISNGTSTIERSLGACQVMARSTGNPEPVREMYRGALEAFGEWEPEKEEVLTETIVTIEGIKVYYDPFKLRFFAKINGKEVRRKHLSEIEKEIKVS